MSEPAQEPAVDVERLVDELRERVARMRAAGAYADDLTGIDLELPAESAPVVFRPQLAYSTKRGVGKPLTLLKRAILRLLVHVFDDLARQTSTAVQRLDGELREVRRHADEALAAEAVARSRAERDLQSLMGRIEALERLETGVRLARLERSRPAGAAAAPRPRRARPGRRRRRPDGLPRLQGPLRGLPGGDPRPAVVVSRRARGPAARRRPRLRPR
ncbi:hypothetical protein [Miltoncostaea marina]|uniref:hypothetical protein n=1 Tax=Miltoncostaea marina TaxID=2843215 RepID=UPI001FE447B5|nr:hypothetical protein [Miltoncostaea marina]